MDATHDIIARPVGLAAAAIVASVANAELNIDRVSAAEKGSVLVYPLAEVRFAADGTLRQDTFLTLVNDYGAPVDVQVFLVNGDPPLDADGGERAHPGWNWSTSIVTLGGDEPIMWSLAEGLADAIAPFTGLDPGPPPGRPDPDGSTDRVVRGCVYAWPVSAAGHEISWNHLSGSSTIVDYGDGTIARYEAAAHRAVFASRGSPTGSPGVINLDGFEFDQSHDRLLMDFQAIGSTAFSSALATVVSETRLALLAAPADLRIGGEAPVTTRAVCTIWNENAIKFIGTARCLTWWDARSLSAYDAPNFFEVNALQTDHGWVRLDTEVNEQCETPDVFSQPTPLLGVTARTLAFPNRAVTATTLRGDGFDASATIRFDVLGQPPETPPPLSPGADGAPDRASVSDEGSVLVLPNITVGWNAGGDVTRDTFITLENHGPQPVTVRVFLVQGDPPLAIDSAACERAHAGHTHVETLLTLAPEQPTFWSAATGLPAGLPPATTLDPGLPAGRPDPAAAGGRMLRGAVYMWAATTDREEIRWNHLTAGATIVDYAAETAWAYPAVAFKAVDDAIAPGTVTGTPGALHLDGVEFAPPYDRLLLDFPSVAGDALSGPRIAVNDVALALVPVDIDLRADGAGPVKTTAVWEVWSAQQVRLTGMARCITGWDRSLLSTYDAPNHFATGTLHSGWGKARVDGRATPQCNGNGDGDPVSAALLGTVAIPVVLDGADPAIGGATLRGMGAEPAVILADLLPAPPPGEPCAADVDGDGHVAFSDILEIIIGWGPCCLCPQDVDRDQEVGFSDVLLVVINWGPC